LFERLAAIAAEVKTGTTEPPDMAELSAVLYGAKSVGAVAQGDYPRSQGD
jgi:hypothetical protein